MTSNKRVLIVDDNEALAEVLAHDCRMAGLVVETAKDGLTARQKIASFKPDLVVLDVNTSCGNAMGICEMMARDPVSAAFQISVLNCFPVVKTQDRCRILRDQCVAKCKYFWSRLELLINYWLGLPAPQPSTVEKASDGGNSNRRTDREHSRPLRVHDPRRNNSGQSGSFGKLLAPGERLTKEDHIQEQYIETVLSAFGGRAPENDAGPARAHTTHSALRPRVLCIDDDNDLLNSLSLRLEEYGIETNQANSGTKGYLQAFLSEVHVIILDYGMPNGNGDYVLRRLKDNPVTSRVPVIVLSGRKDRALERTLSNLGAVRYLTKPVQWDELIGELRRHIRVAPELHRYDHPKTT